MLLPKDRNIRSDKLRKSAKGEDCLIRSAWCNGRPETVVGCHLNHSWAGKGIGYKAGDLVIYGCSGCHAAMDQNELTDRQILKAFYLTMKRMIEKGVLRIG